MVHGEIESALVTSLRSPRSIAKVTMININKFSLVSLSSAMYRTRLQHYFIFFEQVNFIIVFCGRTAIMSTAGSSPTSLALPGAPLTSSTSRGNCTTTYRPTRVTLPRSRSLRFEGYQYPAFGVYAPPPFPYQPSPYQVYAPSPLAEQPAPAHFRAQSPLAPQLPLMESPEGEEAKETKDEKGRARGKRDEGGEDEGGKCKARRLEER